MFSTDLLRILRDSIDIIIVAYFIYRVLLLFKGTRAASMLGGLAFVVTLYFLSKPLGLVTLGWILGNFLSSIILVIVVIFQDEIRRGLIKVGKGSLIRRNSSIPYDKVIEEITLVSTKLAKEKIGALMVFQRDVGLDELLEDAIILDAKLNRKLLYSIFLKDSPLHDGAVLLVGDRIKAAGCFLPLSFNPDLDPSLGTRHRAALGLSERSDAVVVIVSEETGAISLVRDGRLVRNLDAAMLRDSLHRIIGIEENYDTEFSDEDEESEAIS